METARTLNPRRLLLALLGELHREMKFESYRAVDIIGVLNSAGVSQPAARAALDRLVLRGLLLRDRVGRGVNYRLTDAGKQVLADGAARVHASTPFEPRGSGWTIVTFSVPEEQRGLRQHIRAALTWAGFAPLRDGVWIAAGERDLTATIESVNQGTEQAEIVAFRAHDMDVFPMGHDRVESAWDLSAVRQAHEEFLELWDVEEPCEHSTSPLAALTLLVADWVKLLRQDPRLPAEFLGADWPAARSHAIYRACRARLDHAIKNGFPATEA